MPENDADACIMTEAGTAGALVSTAGARLNSVFQRRNRPYRFISHPAKLPSDSQVKAPVSHAGRSFLQDHVSQGHPHAMRRQRSSWWCGIQDHDTGFAQREPEEVLDRDLPDIGLVEITGPQRRVLQTTVCKTE